MFERLAGCHFASVAARRRRRIPKPIVKLRPTVANKTLSRETTKVEVTQPSVSSLSQLPGRPSTRSGALLMLLATALRAEYAPRLKRFCQERLTQVSVAMPRVCKSTIGRAWDISLYIRKHKVAPMIRPERQFWFMCWSNLQTLLVAPGNPSTSRELAKAKLELGCRRSRERTGRFQTSSLLVSISAARRITPARS